MLKEPVSKLIPSLAIPTIISMLITSIYNMADTFFVGHLGVSQSGAVGVIFSVMALIQAFAFTLGMGSGINVSKSLGAGDNEKAETYVSVCFFTTFALGVIIFLLGTLFLDPLITLLGATPTIAPYAKEYARYIFMAAPFMMCSYAMNNLIRFQGMALYGMIGITTGGILNMILDPILIYGLNMEIAGAAIATAISQFTSFCILLFMCNARKAVISITPKNFNPTLKIYGNILYNGVPSLGRQGIASVSTIILNNIARGYGDIAISALSIVTRYTMFINSSVIGFGQGFQPVASFNYGAKQYGRVRTAYWFCLKVAAVILSVLAIASFAFAPYIVNGFIEDSGVIELGTKALRLQMISMPFWSLYTMNNMLTQSIGYGGRATVIACARQGIFLIPMLLILPTIFKLNGLIATQPVADILSVILSAIIVSGILKKLQQMENQTVKAE